MLKLLGFYLQHALRNMWRNRKLTLFALVTVAVGVGTVVGLRTLSLMVGDTLQSNAQAVLRGDIMLRSRRGMDFGALLGIQEIDTSGSVINPADMQYIYQFAEQRGIEVTKTIDNKGLQVSLMRDGQPGAPRLIEPIFVETEVFPFYDTIRAEKPANAKLAELVQSPTDVVIARSLADQLGAEIGDQIRAGAVEQLFTVRGIVPNNQAGMHNFLATLFGFAYFDIDAVTYFNIPDTPNRLFLRIPGDMSVDDIDHQIRRATGVASITVTELLRDSEVASEALGRMSLVFSLTSLFIGGIGIINTMLVVVSRRTLEIAVLKTLGLKGRQITLLFLTEAFVLGVLGSALGILLGFGMVGVVQLIGVSEAVIAQSLVWNFTLDPIIIGAIMGVIITTIFGFLPTLAAGQVRPAIVLRPNDLPIPRAGKLRTLFVLVLMTVVLGVMVGQIANPGPVMTRYGPDFFTGKPPLSINLIIGITGTTITMILLGIVVGLLWVLVWLLGYLPSFGNVDLKLAIRALRGHRTRNASTLFALIVGIASLSVITLITGTIERVLQAQLSEAVGGNVVALSFTGMTSQGVINVLDRAEGVEGYVQYDVEMRMQLVAINDVYDFERYVRAAGLEPQAAHIISSRLDRIWGVHIGGEPIYPPLYAGEQITSKHMGEPVVVIPGTPEVLALGLKPGDTLTYVSRNLTHEIKLTIIGITELPEEASFDMQLLGMVPYAPVDVLRQETSSSSPIEFKMTFANVAESFVNPTLADLGALAPQPLVFDLSLIDSLISRILNQIKALPTFASFLSLAAGAVIIANTVALATLERRREVGIMKALGLKGRRVLGLLLIENTIIGLVSGLIGVGFGALPAAWIGTELTQGALTLALPVGSVIGLMAMSIGIAIGATMLTAWGASRQKPMSVLRYE